MRKLLPSAAITFLLGTAAVPGFIFLQRNPALLLLFLNGTGVSDTAAHSVLQREGAFSDTLLVFMQHPVIGRSLGGVAPAIAELHGEHIISFEQSKLFEGMSVYAEVLAASGIIGIIPFLWFSIAIVRKPLLLAPTTHPELTAILRAGVRSLLFALAILQFNQNILRPYLWVHVSILAITYSIALRPKVAAVAISESGRADANTVSSNPHTRSL